MTVTACPGCTVIQRPVRCATGAITGSELIAGAVVSTACFGVALVVLHRLTELELGPEAARWAIWALALFPMSFFFSAVYTESLFLAASVGAIYAARRGSWALAGLAAGFLAAALGTVPFCRSSNVRITDRR